MSNRLCILGFISLLTSLSAYAQPLKGRVIDTRTKAPMAFVNLGIEGTRQGTMTDIDGRFTLKPNVPVGAVQVSFVGYATRRIPFDSTTTKLLIELTLATALLNEVVVRPGLNPAHTIMDRVLANRPANNPENLPAFRYNAYTKLYATPANGFALGSSYADEAAETTTFDTTNTTVGKDPSHLFMSESYSERMYKAPGKSQETVLANRVSGFSNPLFSIVGTQLQPFGFYASTLTVFDKDYLNPINPGYARTYDLDLVDTVFRETDSLYVIRFKPQTKRSFEGLAGVMHISTDGYAVQTIMAQSLDKSQPLAFRVQQQYQKVAGQWFPDQLHTDLFVQGDSVPRLDKKTKKPIPSQFLFVIRTYLSNVAINPPLTNAQFGYQTTRLAPTMNKTPQSAWDTLRAGPLSRSEAKTYVFYDRLRSTRAGRVGRTLDFVSKLTEAFLLGRVPVGKVDLLMNRWGWVCKPAGN